MNKAAQIPYLFRALYCLEDHHSSNIEKKQESDDMSNTLNKRSDSISDEPTYREKTAMDKREDKGYRKHLSQTDFPKGNT